MESLDPTPLLGTSSPSNDDDPVHLHPLMMTVMPSDQDEQRVPTVSTLYEKIKRTLWQFRYPLGVLAANIVSWILVMVLLHGPMEYLAEYGDGSNGWANFQYKAVLSVGLAIALFTCLANAYLSWQAAKHVQAKLVVSTQTLDGAGSENAPPTETDETHVIDVLKLSRQIDAAFGFQAAPSHSSSLGGGQEPRQHSTFVVCLLYALFSLSVWQAADQGARLFLLHFWVPNRSLVSLGKCFVGMPFNSDYYYFGMNYQGGISSLADMPEFTQLPDNIQLWIQRTSHSGWEFNRSLPYVAPMQDGSAAFVKAMSCARSYRRTKSDTKNLPGVVVQSPKNGEMIVYNEHPDGYEPDNERALWFNGDFVPVELVGFPAEPPYRAWCGVFANQEFDLLRQGVVCYDTDTASLGRFPSVMDMDKNVNGGKSGESSLYATDDTLWMISVSRRTQKETQENKVLLSSFDTVTMDHQLVLSKNTTQSHDERRAQPSAKQAKCRVFDWVRTVATLVPLGLVTHHLYRLDIASCAVPATVAVAVLMDELLEVNVAGFILLGLAVFCLYLLLTRAKVAVVARKYVSAEMLVWGLYSLQIAVSWDFWEQSMNPYYWDDLMWLDSYVSIPMMALIVATATAILLNHPVFQILAVCFSSVGFLSFFFIFAGLNYLLVPVILLSLALGFFQAGRLLQTYRVHLIIYIRRLCRSCSALARFVTSLRPP